MTAYRFEFEPDVQLVEAEETLHLAMVSVHGLFGEARVRLEAAYHLDESNRTITVDASTEVGATIVKVFTGLLIRELGESAFRVRPASPTREPVAA